ncbi:MAG: ferredoxin [Acidobacteria bacterium]|nr:MAG: ferredoxin [Acidobacteriota bacterium]
MANRHRKHPENQPGRYYVDESCIASKFCVATAARNFVMVGDHAVVIQQPGSAEEEVEVREALAGCPVNAIGDDRES